eukprot:6461387-Pyramimonas_sp.AAC.1
MAVGRRAFVPKGAIGKQDQAHVVGQRELCPTTGARCFRCARDGHERASFTRHDIRKVGLAPSATAPLRCGLPC